MFDEIFDLNWWGQVIAGVAVFLLGIEFMGEGLKKIAGSKLKDLIDKFTATPIKGILIGMIITVLIQSSSATTALVIGLISAGIMTLRQGFGVIMGANIGTTITAFLIGLNITPVAPFIMLVGVIMLLFIAKAKVKAAGQTLFGFGIIFFGLNMMETCLKPIASLPEFSNIITGIANNPLLGILIGALATAAIQSSSAFIGVLQALYSTSVEVGVADFTLRMVIPLLIGSNIGTTITGILASLSGKPDAKRAATFHVIFNLLGAIIFMILLVPYSNLMILISESLNISPKMQIAYSHIIFNLITTLLLFPFVNLIATLIEKIIPKRAGETINVDLSSLNHNITDISPITALEIARKQTVVMGSFVIQSIENLIQYFNTKNKENKDLVFSIEETVDLFNEKLTKFLQKMEKVKLRETDIKMYTVVLKAFRDIERISDHCENIVEFIQDCYDSNKSFSEESSKDINELLTLALEMTKESMETFENNSQKDIAHILELETKMDNLYKQARHDHSERMANDTESITSPTNTVFCDIITNIERIGDHCTNIVEDCEF